MAKSHAHPPAPSTQSRAAQESAASSPAQRGPMSEWPSPSGPAIQLKTKTGDGKPGAKQDPGETFSAATAGAGRAIPHQEKMEAAFGQDFSGVQAYTGKKSEMGALGAHAAAQGDKVAFADSNPSEKLVAHEMTHVVQSRQGGGGGVSPAGHAKVSSRSDSAEKEADAVASRVAGGGSAGPISQAPSAGISRDQEFGEPMDSVGTDEQALFKPEREFKVEVLKSKVPNALKPGDIPKTSVLRRFDQFAPHVDPFIISFNLWRFQQALMWESLAEMKHHEANEGISADPTKSVGMKLGEDGRFLPKEQQNSKDLQAMKENLDPRAMADASGQKSVGVALLGFTEANQLVSSAIEGVRGAEADMKVYVAGLDRDEAAGEIAKINKAISDLQAGLKMSIGLGLKLAGAMADPVSAAKDAGPGLLDAALDGILGWFAKKAYEKDLKAAEVKLADAKSRIAEGTKASFVAKLAKAQEDLAAAKTKLAKSAMELKDAIENKKNYYKAAGAEMDKPLSKEDHKITRYKAIMVMAALTRQSGATAEACLKSLDNPAFWKWFGFKDLGPAHNMVPGRGDLGQERMATAMGEVRSYWYWAKKHVPPLRVYADGWKAMMKTLGYSDDNY